MTSLSCLNIDTWRVITCRRRGVRRANPYSHRLEVLFHWVLPGPIGGKRREEPRSPATAEFLARRRDVHVRFACSLACRPDLNHILIWWLRAAQRAPMLCLPCAHGPSRAASSMLRADNKLDKCYVPQIHFFFQFRDLKLHAFALTRASIARAACESTWPG